ncbi:cytochrome C oxidase subunit IV family protein [Nocardia gipuzkoensis]|uniref:cytochrome C oxidase subunit IV family protein n=1 Tax=Nocardia gipuzkoensis TaxID=2749991 RepID=UPI003EDF4CAC
MKEAPVPGCGSAVTAVRIIAVWAVLIVLTVIARVESGHSSSQAIAVMVLAVSMAKVWLVVHSYMEIARAPLWLKILCTAWITVVASMLLSLLVVAGFAQ